MYQDMKTIRPLASLKIKVNTTLRRTIREDICMYLSQSTEAVCEKVSTHLNS